MNSPGLARRAPAATRLLTIPLQHDRASVGADLDDVFAGVGMRSRKPRHDRVVAGMGRRPRWWRRTLVSVACRGTSASRRVTICAAMSVASGPLTSHDTNTAPPRRRCNGHNGVVGREHAVTRRRSPTAAAPAYCLAEMMTVFMNASPMLSELTVGSSAMAI